MDIYSMMRFSVAAAGVAIAAGCTTVVPSEIEAIRAEGAHLRERQPGRPVGGSGTLEQAKAFAATGESEEIDYWRLTSEPTAAERADLRAAFDGAGGRAVQILGPKDAWKRPATAPHLAVAGLLSGPVLAAGTDRVFLAGPDGSVKWEKRGCGNVHCVRRHGKFVYYSNGAIYRVPSESRAWACPERVWAPSNAAGGGALCFDLTSAGTLVIAVNSTCEVVELDIRTRVEIVRFPVDAKDAKGEMPGAHGKIRCVRKTDKGTYLVSCAGAETVREYDKTGRLVWSVKAPAFTFDAVRRPNGNTVVSHVTGLTEFAPDGTAVWALAPSDIPDIKAANFTALQLRPNGNLVVGTWANGSADATHAGAFEVSPDKKVVWAVASPTDVNMMSAVRE